MGRPVSSSALVLLLALVQCGGEDRGRPEAPVPVEAGAGDPCAATTGLEFQNIADFEGDYAACDSAVSGGAMRECLYLNFDVAAAIETVDRSLRG